MKALDIALKDLTSSFRSAFAVAFMFVLPLLVTGMFYFMLGNEGAESGFTVPVTRVVIANLDQADPAFTAMSNSFPDATAGADSLGAVIVGVLEGEEFDGLLDVSLALDAAAARQTVDEQQAGVAIIIPADFSARFLGGQSQVELEMYADPTLSLGPGIVRSVLQGFMDGISSGKITIDLATAASGSSMPPEQVDRLMQAFIAARPQDRPADALVTSRSPIISTEPKGMLITMLTSIMGAMMVFFAFYTGSATAQTILEEEERRTLPRLFTTPTPPATILGGKFLSVFLTVLVQVTTLLIVSSIVFRIDWGDLARITVFAAGCILSASGFGVFFNSLLKNTKQSGVLFGGVITFTGWIGMIPIFAGSAPGSTSWVNIVSLMVPQGWAIRAMIQSVTGAPFEQVAVSGLVLLLWAAIFFTAGTLRFQKRYI